MSAIGVGHVQTYRDAVDKAGLTVDQSVKVSGTKHPWVCLIICTLGVLYFVIYQVNMCYTLLV